MERNEIFVTGYAKLPQGITAAELYSIIAWECWLTGTRESFRMWTVPWPLKWAKILSKLWL